LKNKYLGTVICLYLSYLIHGMGVIILAQNMGYLLTQLHTDKAGIGYVISAMGIGRLIVLYASGVLSDKFGRRPFIYTGLFVYCIFFGGILISPNVQVAFFLALLAGVANSLMDAGTYPALMEAFPNTPGTANILIKAFMSAGQFLLPIIMGVIIANDLYYGISFIIPIVSFILIGLVLSRLEFPSGTTAKQGKASVVLQDKFIAKPKMWLEGASLIAIGFTCTVTFLVIQIWMPTYGEQVVGMTKADSLQLISYYGMGSLASVFMTSYLVKEKVRPVTVVFVYPIISFISLLGVYYYPTPMVATVGSFIIGFSAAGGVLQLALTSMIEIFPGKKGTITGIIYTASSIAGFVAPFVAGIIAQTNVANIILFDAGITLIGVILAVIVNIRYRKVINMEIKGVQV